MEVFKTESGKQAVLSAYDQLVKAWGVPVEERDVPTRFGDTHVILAGARNLPPLVLLHGVGDNSAVMWVLNMAELSRHFFCIAVDTLGGPGKSRPNEQFQKKQFHQVPWLDDLADALGLDAFHLAGVSNGACMAYTYTVRKPQRVLRTVCLEGGMILNPAKTMLHMLKVVFPEMLVPTRKNRIRVIMKMKPGSDLFTVHPEVLDHILLLMRHHRQSAMMVHPMEPYDRQAGLAVRDKLLFLFGGNMRVGRADFMKVMDTAQFRYLELDGVGHGINHERPEEVNRLMRDFLLDGENPGESG